MKTIKRSLKINKDGCLVEFNYRLKQWELTSRSWSWADIDPDFLKESKQNKKRYSEREEKKVKK